MDNKFRQFCGTINYNTYTKIYNAIGASSIGGLVVNNILLSQYPIINSSIDVLIAVAFALCGYMILSNGELYTKDVNQIKELYQEFINNYNKLNKIFEFNNPVQVYAMFNYLLYKGYLSTNKEFTFTRKEVRDVMPILGSNVIMGKGVCRHISSMLVDILKDYGFDAYGLSCYVDNYELTFKKVEKENYSKEELMNFIENNISFGEMREYWFSAIEEFEKNGIFICLSYEPVKKESIIKRKTGNHVISYVVNDGKSIFLDPSNSCMYRLDTENKDLLIGNSGFIGSLKVSSSLLFNDKDSYLRLADKLRNINQSMSFEEGNTIIDSTVDICRNNMDIFEHFYNDNKELYGEISNKLLKIKTRKI